MFGRHSPSRRRPKGRKTRGLRTDPLPRIQLLTRTTPGLQGSRKLPHILGALGGSSFPGPVTTSRCPRATLLPNPISFRSSPSTRPLYARFHFCPAFFPCDLIVALLRFCWFFSLLLFFNITSRSPMTPKERGRRRGLHFWPSPVCGKKAPRRQCPQPQEAQRAVRRRRPL